MNERRKHILVGVGVTTVALFVPVLDFVAPAFGGAAAGYVQDDGIESGYKIGARMGGEFTIGALLIGLPLVILAMALLGVAGGSLQTILGLGAVGLVVVLAAVVVLSVWAIGFGALGGAVGGAIAAD